MREILFRGKTENGEWKYGAYYHQTEFYGDKCDYRYIISSCDELEDNMMCFEIVIPSTIGQYTGLTDKNGKKIFEGDIVEILTENGENGFITYDDGGFLVEAEGFCVTFQSNINGTDVEVIGNIHDNPEKLQYLESEVNSEADG